ncbi:MAG: DUF2550 domain-containing protein [Actinomycetes bacterium]
MSGLVVPIWVVAGLAAALVLVVVFFVVRRVALTSGFGSFDCSVLGRGHEGRWTTGIASYGNAELRWFRMFSLSPRPSRVWPRNQMHVKQFRSPEGSEVYAVIPGAVVVTCLVGAMELTLAMSPDAYTGLASWIEAAPPGQHARVT